MKVELRFKPISTVSTDYLVVTIEGEPQKVLLSTPATQQAIFESVTKARLPPYTIRPISETPK